MTTTTARRVGLDQQPASSIEWVPREKLRANSWNPNVQAPPELRLLKLSILEDGWTQPIVARRDFEIVDGYHRWLVSDDPQVAAMTDGLVPVAWIADDTDPAQQRMATIRHNRARGTHHVLKMADIVAFLVDELGVPPEEVERRLQMEDEEVDRLLDRGQMTKRGHDGQGLGNGWVPR